MREYKENNLLTTKILTEIEVSHNVEIKYVYKNVLVKCGEERPVEFDALLLTHTPTGKKRFFSIELKEADVTKVISQLANRREFVDYAYAVLDVSLPFLAEYLLSYAELIRSLGLGIFTREELVLRSKYKKREVEDFECE
ncbi:hypothetical protein J7J18_04500 [bacterium]|nr:hypothetical protein [bacterium]